MARKSNVPSVTHAASLAGRAMARLQKAASEAVAEDAASHNKSLQLIASKGNLSALIRCGKVTIQIENDDFSVIAS